MRALTGTGLRRPFGDGLQTGKIAALLFVLVRASSALNLRLRPILRTRNNRGLLPWQPGRPCAAFCRMRQTGDGGIGVTGKGEAASPLFRSQARTRRLTIGHAGIRLVRYLAETPPLNFAAMKKEVSRRYFMAGC